MACAFLFDSLKNIVVNYMVYITHSLYTFQKEKNMIPTLISANRG